MLLMDAHRHFMRCSMAIPRKLATLIGLLLQAGCMLGENQRGELAYIDTQIVFVSADGSPLAAQPVFVAETIGMLVTVTDNLTTDRDGSVRVVGRLCTPAIVGMDGGYVELRPGALQSRTVVAVSNDRSPRFPGCSGQCQPIRPRCSIPPAIFAAADPEGFGLLRHPIHHSI
jgi:hypothetical protein